MLRLLLQRAGLDQTDLANRSGVHRGSINRYVAAVKEPGLGTTMKLLSGMSMDLHDLQDAFDEVSGRPPQQRPTRPVDAKALTRLRIAHPRAPKELLEARAAVELELRDALGRADKLDELLAAAATVDIDDAGDVAGDEDKKLRELLGLRLKRRHPDWTPEHLDAEVERRIQAEAERDSGQPREG